MEGRQTCKVLQTQEMTKAWKKSYSRVNNFLVDSEKQKGRHSVFNFVVNNLTAQVIEEKLDRVPDKLKCAAKFNLVLGFILKKTEDGKFGDFYAHENNTLVGTVKTCE